MGRNVETGPVLQWGRIPYKSWVQMVITTKIESIVALAIIDTFQKLNPNLSITFSSSFKHTSKLTNAGKNPLVEVILSVCSLLSTSLGDHHRWFLSPLKANRILEIALTSSIQSRPTCILPCLSFQIKNGWSNEKTKDQAQGNTWMNVCLLFS